MDNDEVLNRRARVYGGCPFEVIKPITLARAACSLDALDLALNVGDADSKAKVMISQDPRHSAFFVEKPGYSVLFSRLGRRRR
jgi:hypothetical protein